MSSTKTGDNRVVHLVAGALAGAGTTTLLHPLDLVKVRFQVDPTHPSKQPRQAFHTLRYLYDLARQSPSSLYQGFTANFLANMASWGLYFYIYENVKRSFLPSESTRFRQLVYFGASGVAGMTTICLVNPLWVIKTRMCLQSRTDPTRYRNVLDALLRIGQREGLRGLYRGLVPGLFGVSHGAVQFTVYENLKRCCNLHQIEQSNTVYLAMSTSSKIAAMALTYPYQCVRSRLQVRLHGDDASGYPTLRDVVRRTWRGEGLLGFYKGIVPSTLRVLPGTAITFLVYENVSRYLRADPNTGLKK